MLKKTLSFLVLATTVLRLGSLVYLLLLSSTNLPAPVLVITFLIMLYGLFLILKRLFLSISLRNYLWFFIIQPAAITINMIAVKATTPLQLSLYEIIVVGTFLDILIAVGAVYFCAGGIRKSYVKGIGADKVEN